ncbi:hypothetical protein IX317_001327 [Fusobacterium sp. DD29]|uniref:hypothetical protein n=1 Tax=unclassified Fusobacterium TaxID=2648384 RepID=UPI001B8CFF76|nr:MULTISPECIES: hypothetical protein [unclassified Fusobacterium]MBR8701429.1 hypothetical protein [Fusobacterium sp. DD45]MBR8711185.1 hypothetical protein [Fusobacterium sp. DD28]MBR8749652.1 hypothetical protein [Fusobacterium sp. DD29]MBR8751759.1 hypothetical protein [Fusobacterium sp. DD26]MBR8761913.1 hypothetical protein [Fusobacterium sp. DD25]
MGFIIALIGLLIGIFGNWGIGYIIMVFGILFQILLIIGSIILTIQNSIKATGQRISNSYDSFKNTCFAIKQGLIIGITSLTFSGVRKSSSYYHYSYVNFFSRLKEIFFTALKFLGIGIVVVICLFIGLIYLFSIF